MQEVERFKERHDTCVHADACDQAYAIHGRWYETEVDWMPCDSCEVYDSQHCPMSLSGTMRCKGLYGGVKDGHES